MFQNKVLLDNLEELKEKTDELKTQNDELLLMNNYLVEKAYELEEKERLFRKRQAKRKSAKKLERRDYIDSTDFFEIAYKIMPKLSKESYVVARTRIACFLMYFSGL